MTQHSRPGRAPGLPRLVWVTGPAALVLVSLVVLGFALDFGGGVEAPRYGDPGAVVRWGLPYAKLLVNLAVAVTIGALTLVCFALSPDEPEYDRAMDVAAAAAGVWTVAAAAESVFVFSSVYGSVPSLDPSFGSGLGTFLSQTSLGQAWLIMALAGALLTIVCFALRNRTALLIVLAATTLPLLRLSSEGHTGDSATHDQAMIALWLHIGAAAVWIGGLATIIVLRPRLSLARLSTLLHRYSTLALMCFVVVAVSGYISAQIRVGDLPGLLTPYGGLLIAKALGLIALGVFGAIQRRWLLARLSSSTFWILVVVELAIMGLASGLAAGLAQTAPPLREPGIGGDPTPAELLTNRPVPAELEGARWLTSWELDPLAAVLCGFGIFFYLAGVWRLRRRGDAWPIHRTILWIIGMLLLAWVTNGALNVYKDYLFSAHMGAHMLLTMAVPILLVLAAPITLALRTIRPRHDGSRGPREWIMLATQSRLAAFLTHPLVAAALFALSLWAFYYSPLFRWATAEHVGHMWMVAHFLITGYLFALALVGVDPVPRRPPYPLRLVLLLVVMAMHAFFGLALLQGEGLLLADWYGAMGRIWGPSPLEDQQTGGAIAWSIGEIPTLALAIIVAIQWNRHDRREQRRLDRAADRDGDAALNEYNRMLRARAGGRHE